MPRYIHPILVLAALLLLGGCKVDPNNPDPNEKLNRFFYDINDGLDRFLIKPVTDVYVKIIPIEVRTGVNNAFDNLGYANVIVNDLLQGKLDQAASDSGRMAVNSTLGIGGFFDPAEQWKMPRHHNDFGTTLAQWGADQGPYLVLPFYGPSTARDAPGIVVSMVTNPLFWINVRQEITIPLDVLGILNARSDVDSAIRFRDRAAVDPYIFTREAYLTYRRFRTGAATRPVDPGFYDEPTTRP